ncbi:pyridoxamine 5'-phosphate oxidase family protein [Salinilacihabitans rarus]|uniref:pyridoxamine 5'-phosphate oxidase family protein n=1 Tax=Salinilacihabitans rarus TaxID=2961596 RepID=UPI0020C89618|nr:pyridoxamine 5'-phosphate oxidase family protein [Salinilacihabitans rarus]
MRVRGGLAREEVEAFLEATAVPVRVACRTPSGHLWMLSLWFLYRDGRLHCATSASADVVEYVESDPGVAFEVSTNEPPYRGVRGRGTAAVAPDEGKELLRALLERYLGGTDSPLADRLLAEGREEVRIAIDPDAVYGWDYSGRMRASE